MSELDSLVQRLLSDLGVPAAPPVDVGLVARRLGLDVRRERLSGADGVLQIEGDRPVIVVEFSRPRARARFTLAHELGHYLVASHPQEVAAVWQAQPSLRDPERFCDRFAESMLLPSGWIERELRSCPPSLQQLVWVASTAQVSISAASVRMTRVARWRRTLLRFSRVRGRWSLLSVTGLLRPGWRRGLEMTAGTARRLDVATELDSVDHPVWLPLRVDGEPCYANAEVARSATSAVAWVDLLERRPAARGNRPESGLPTTSVRVGTDGPRT